MQPEIIQTTVTRAMLSSMERTHERRRISVYSGPPGIGKTTAIKTFAAKHPTNVALVPPFTRKATERYVYQAMTQAVRRISASRYAGIETSLRMSYVQLEDEIRIWCGYTHNQTIEDFENAPLLTFVFDEAQNIPPDTLDALRHLNDGTRYKDRIKIGLIFVGNHEFSLEVDLRGRSAMLDAFKDRVLHNRPFQYDDLSGDDIARFAASRGVSNPDALKTIVRAFAAMRGSRSLRRVGDLIDDIKDEAGGAEITVEHVRTILNPG